MSVLACDYFALALGSGVLGLDVLSDTDVSSFILKATTVRGRSFQWFKLSVFMYLSLQNAICQRIITTVNNTVAYFHMHSLCVFVVIWVYVGVGVCVCVFVCLFCVCVCACM